MRYMHCIVFMSLLVSWTMFTESFYGSMVLRNKTFNQTVSVAGSLDAQDVIFKSDLSVYGSAHAHNMQAREVRVNGGFHAEHSRLRSATINGGVNLEDVTIDDTLRVNGGVNITGVTVQELIVNGGMSMKKSKVRSVRVNATDVVLEQSQIMGNVVMKASENSRAWWCPFSWCSAKVVTPEVKCIDTQVNGAIVFEGTPGIVHVYGKHQQIPKVENGTVEIHST